VRSSPVRDGVYRHSTWERYHPTASPFRQNTSAELSPAVVARFDRASPLRSSGFNAVARNLYIRRRTSSPGPADGKAEWGVHIGTPHSYTQRFSEVSVFFTRSGAGATAGRAQRVPNQGAPGRPARAPQPASKPPLFGRFRSRLPPRCQCGPPGGNSICTRP